MSNKIPKPKVRGGISNLTKVVKQKSPLRSSFLLTINTNQKYDSDDKFLQNDAELFDECVQDILNNIGDYIKLPDEQHWSEEFIKNVDSDYTVERGTIKGRLHCHILMRFEHFTKIQLDYGKIKAKILKDTGLLNIYMYNKLIRASSDQNILQYLGKYN